MFINRPESCSNLSWISAVCDMDTVTQTWEKGQNIQTAGWTSLHLGTEKMVILDSQAIALQQYAG